MLNKVLEQTMTNNTNVNSAIDNSIDAYVYLQSILNNIGASETVTLSVTEVNRLRAAGGVSGKGGSQTNTGGTGTGEIQPDTVAISKAQLERLTGAAANNIMSDENSQIELSPKQLVELFKSSFTSWGENERNEELETLINKLIEMGVPFNDTLNLFRFFDQIRMTQDYDENLRGYCTFYITQMENYASFKDVATTFNKELNEKLKKNQMGGLGEIWNTVKHSGMIEHFSVTPQNVH